MDSVISRMDTKNVGDINLLIYAGGAVFTYSIDITQGKDLKEQMGKRRLQNQVMTLRLDLSRIETWKPIKLGNTICKS